MVPAAKISWTAFGTRWSPNITPDRDTGIGAWSDREIGPAIRRGVTPDGRSLRRQGMIWDHASNWDEEDVRTFVAHLRGCRPSAGPCYSRADPPRAKPRSNHRSNRCAGPRRVTCQHAGYTPGFRPLLPGP
jgi:hypothetical protein